MEDTIEEIVIENNNKYKRSNSVYVNKKNKNYMELKLKNKTGYVMQINIFSVKESI